MPEKKEKERAKMPGRKQLWKTYELTISITDRLMGGIPKHEGVIASWLEARKPSEAAYAKMEDATPLPELTEQVIEEVGATDEKEKKVWCGFKQDDNGLYVNGYHVKAHMKDNGNILQKFLDMSALKSKLADRLFVLETKLYLGVKEPGGYWEHPVHVMTQQGPRSALKRNDYVERPLVSCTLKVLNDNVITRKILETVLEFGCMKGFGAERGLGNGRYTYKLVEIN